MAQYVAKFRPGVPILCITPDLVAARQASGLLQGVHTIMVDSLQQPDTLLEEISYELLHGGLNAGDRIVLIAGRLSGFKERLQVVELTEEAGAKTHGHIVKGGGFFFSRGLLLSYSV